MKRPIAILSTKGKSRDELKAQARQAYQRFLDAEKAAEEQVQRTAE